MALKKFKIILHFYESFVGFVLKVPLFPLQAFLLELFPKQQTVANSLLPESVGVKFPEDSAPGLQLGPQLRQLARRAHHVQLEATGTNSLNR